MNVAERLRVHYLADAPMGWTITPPSVPAKLDGWRIVRNTVQESEDVAGARTRLELVLVLEPFLPGEKAVPSLQFSSSPQPTPPQSSSGGSPAQPASIKTQPIKIVVERLISDGVPVPLALQGPLSMELPAKEMPRWVWAVGGAGVMGFACAVAWLLASIWKRSSVPLNPVQKARAELRAISLGTGEQSPDDATNKRELAATVSRHFRTVLGVAGLPGSEHKSAREIMATPDFSRLTADIQGAARSLLSDLERAVFDPSFSPDARAVRLLASRSLTLIDALEAHLPQHSAKAACLTVLTLGLVDWPVGLEWHTPLALLLLVLPIAAAIWLLISRRRAMLPLPLSPTFAPLPQTLRSRLTWVPRSLTLLAAVALIIALARPRLGFARTESSTEAIAIQIVIDRSGSMGAEMDLDGSQLSRLDVVKRVLRDFLLGDSKTLPGRYGDLVGLVSFARFADTNCPLVRDMNAVVQLADALEPAREQFEGGTAIGDGLALAAARLKTAEQELASRAGSNQDADLKIKSKAIVLLTDGDNNVGTTLPEEAAELCKQWGIKIYVIGIGGGGTTLLQTPFGDRRVPVASEVNERNLRPLAEQTGGAFRLATDADSLRRIYAEFDRLEKSSVRTSEFTDYTELFMYPATIGFVSLSLSSLLGSTWLRRVPA